MSSRVFALAALGCAAVAFAVLPSREDDPAGKPSAAAPEGRFIARTETAQAPATDSFATRIGITPDSVEDLGVFTARSGAMLRVLTGRRAADGRQCLIVRDAGGSGQSCAHDLFARGPITTLETFRADPDGRPAGDYHLIGLAERIVKRVEVATSAGARAEVTPTSRGAFVFTLSDEEVAGGVAVERLTAHGASGSLVGEVTLPTRQRP